MKGGGPRTTSNFKEVDGQDVLGVSCKVQLLVTVDFLDKVGFALAGVAFRTRQSGNGSARFVQVLLSLLVSEIFNLETNKGNLQMGHNVVEDEVIRFDYIVTFKIGYFSM